MRSECLARPCVRSPMATIFMDRAPPALMWARRRAPLPLGRVAATACENGAASYGRRTRRGTQWGCGACGGGHSGWRGSSPCPKLTAWSAAPPSRIARSCPFPGPSDPLGGLAAAVVEGTNSTAPADPAPIPAQRPGGSGRAPRPVFVRLAPRNSLRIAIPRLQATLSLLASIRPGSTSVPLSGLRRRSLGRVHIAKSTGYVRLTRRS